MFYTCNVCNKKFYDYFQFLGHLNLKGHNEQVLEYIQNNQLPIDVVHDLDRLSNIEKKIEQLLNPIKKQASNPISIVPIIPDNSLEEKEYFIAKCFLHTGYKPFDLKNKMYILQSSDTTIYDYNGYLFTKFYNDIYLSIKDNLPEHLTDFYKNALLFDKHQEKIMTAYNSLIISDNNTTWESRYS